MKRLALPFVSVMVCVAAATPARAELAFFASGRAMSIRGHHLDGDSLVLSLRSGGEVVCEPATIVRFAPDEVPYPEPAAVATPTQAPTPSTAAAEVVPFGEIIDSVAAEHGVSARLVRAVIKVESDYQE